MVEDGMLRQDVKFHNKIAIGKCKNTKDFKLRYPNIIYWYPALVNTAFYDNYRAAYIRKMESDANRPKVDEPLNVVKASRQYVFTDNGEEYLDCLNGSVHIGHSHPQVN